MLAFFFGLLLGAGTVYFVIRFKDGILLFKKRTEAKIDSALKAETK